MSILRKSVWDDQEFLDKVEKSRNLRRFKNGRITFDCLNLKVRGERASCPHTTVLLFPVLRGVLYTACKNCQDFKTGEDSQVKSDSIID